MTANSFTEEGNRVPKIYIGWRSANGILEQIEGIDTQKIPKNIQQTGRFKWNGNLCINFTGKFLEFLKQTIVGEGVWRIRRAARSPVIEVFRIAEHGTGEIIRQSFLDWRTVGIHHRTKSSSEDATEEGQPLAEDAMSA